MGGGDDIILAKYDDELLDWYLATQEMHELKTNLNKRESDDDRCINSEAD